MYGHDMEGTIAPKGTGRATAKPPTRILTELGRSAVNARSAVAEANRATYVVTEYCIRLQMHARKCPPNRVSPNTSHERLAKSVDSASAQRPTISASRVSPFSLEITGKNVAQIRDFKFSIPLNTPVNVAFLGNESHRQRILAAKTIRECGFEPVPIISARRIRSQQDLDDLLGTLVMEATPRCFIFVGGDPRTPSGPYPDSLSLLGSGVLARHRIRDVGIVGYPEGHPKIQDAKLRRALSWKIAFLEDAGCSIEITTQFGFDADAIARWIDQLRAMAISAPVRIGVPGPATVATLLRFAAQFGVSVPAGAAKHSFSLASQVRQVGPDRFIERLWNRMSEQDVGSVLLHIYPFGGMGPSVRWIDRYKNDREARNWPHLHAS
jgi:methylenetetrahydrofolate reductase (NADPH)